MKIIELHVYFGEAHPQDRVVYIAADDISTICSLENKHTHVTFKGSADASMQIVESVDYVLAKWREATRG